MDRDIWTTLMKALRRVERRMPQTLRACRYPDRLIVRMALWAIGHDRPMVWACHRQNYHSVFRPRELPSQSQFSRRLRRSRIQTLLDQMQQHLVGPPTSVQATLIDGKPLPVSNYSRDPEARNGYGRGRMECGYKLHAWVLPDGRIPRFSVRSLNEGEAQVARTLLADLPKPTLVVGDGNYDSAKLYGTVHAAGSWLVTPLKGQSEHPQRWRAMGEGRRQAIRLWRRRPDICQRLMQRRDNQETTFGMLSGFGGGLGPLPNWVRRLSRVTLWVKVKLLVHHARLKNRKDAAA